MRFVSTDASNLSKGSTNFAHPDWRGFGTQADKHPPMRGWLAVPLLRQDGGNYGLLQLSDKYDDQDFTQEDETQLTRLAQLTAKTLDAIHRIHSE